MAQAGERKGKIQYFEWARAFGALGIVLLHVFIVICSESSIAVDDPARFAAYRVLGMVFARWGVPVFLMVSGALLLDPSHEVGLAKLRRYVGRMLFVICTFGLLFALMQEYVDLGGLSLAMVGASLRDIVFGTTWDHLWYVYAMVGIYALTPLFRAFAARASRAEYRWVLGFLLVFSFAVPTVNGIMGWGITAFRLTIPSCFTYVLLGHYVHTYLRFDRKWAVAACLSVLAMGAFAVWGTFSPDLTPNQVGLIYAPECPLLCVLAVTVFLALRRFLDDVPIERHPLFATIARYSFGIYIIHPLFGHIALRLTDPLDFPPILYEAALFAVSVAGSLLLTYLLKKLPGFKRVL